MPIDPEIAQKITTWGNRLPYDPNRPYRIRRVRKGALDEHGELSGDQYEYRTINGIRTQPLGDQDYARLPEGFREKSWRFVMVVPNVQGQLPSSQDEFLDFGDQFEFKGHWYEVKFINDWDLIQGCKAVFVE